MQVKPGDTIATLTCPDCGQETALKVTKTMTLFVFCRNVTGHGENGKPERCWHREFWGRAKSRAIIAQYEAQNPGEPETIIELRESNNGPEIHQPEIESGNDATQSSGGDGTVPREPTATPAAGPGTNDKSGRWWERPLFGGDNAGA